MGSLIPRANGIYYAVFSQNGKRVCRSTNTRVREDAEVVYANLSKDVVSYRKMTIMQFRERLHALLSGAVGPETIRFYDRALASFAKTVGDRTLQSVNALLVDTFKAQRIQQVSPTTVNIEYRTLKAAFNHAMKYRFIEHNPFLLTKNIRLPRTDAAFLTKEVYMRLLAVIGNNQLCSIIALAVSTGMRRGEIVNLKWVDVHPEDNMIRLTNRADFVTKSGRPRTVFLNASALTVLAGLPHNSEYVFPKSDGTMLCGQSLSRLFKKYVRMAAIPQDIHFHSLRHTAATWLSGKVPLPEVNRLMDHSSTTTTMRYAHVDTPHLLESIQVLNEFLKN